MFQENDPELEIFNRKELIFFSSKLFSRPYRHIERKKNRKKNSFQKSGRDSTDLPLSDKAYFFVLLWYFFVLLCTSLYFSVLLGTSSYFLVLLCTSWYFSVLLGTSRYFFVLLRTSWYFLVLLGTSRYFSVLLRTSSYFLVLLGTSSYFFVLLRTSLYFCTSKVQKSAFSPLDEVHITGVLLCVRISWL